MLHQKGFAMLFTVLIIGLILSIALSISNLTLRQTILSALAKDSGIAFYQADAGVECGMYQDVVLGNFPYQTPENTTTIPDTFSCGDVVLQLDTSVLGSDGNSSTNYYRYVPQSQSIRESPTACFSVVFDKTHLTDVKSYSSVESSGYSSCIKNSRQVERLLRVTY